jgi:hypothetical protein
MRKQSIAVCLFAIGALVSVAAPSAKADSMYSFDYSGTGLTETSIITTTSTLNASGAYTILAVVGQINGVLFTGLSSFASADQFLYPSAPYVDFSGVSFAGANGVDYTVGASGGVVFEADSVTDPSGVLVTNEPVVLTVSEVPEPTSLGLLALGLLAIGLTNFRFRRIRVVTL